MACGRTATHSDAGSDGPRPCRPTCDQICQAQVGCSVVLDSAACLRSCALDSTRPALLCIGQRICDGTLSCEAALSCTLDPRVPDLTITFSANSAASGSITYHARICNLGIGDAPATSVHFYRNRASAPRAGEAGDRVTRLPALPAGHCTSVSAIDSGLPTGSYQTWAQVDAEGAVLETDEEDNVAGPVSVRVSQAGHLADLAITDLVGHSLPSGVDFSALVCNSGDAASTPTAVDLYLDRAVAPGAAEPGNLSTPVPGLAVGACVTLGYYSVALPAGTYQSWARVDRKGAVDESNEANNLYGPVKVHVGSTAKPDLAVSSFKASPLSSGTVTFVTQICNLGQGPAPATTVDLHYNRATPPGPTDAGDQATTIAALGPGSCASASFTAALGPGTYQSWVLVDRADSVPESLESNNSASTTFTVPGPPVDLALTKLGYTIAPTGAGPVTYAATVCNSGKSPTPAVTFNLYYSSASAPSSTTAADKTLTVPALSVGLCYDLTVIASLGPATYKSWGWVDPGNKVVETDESNNLASISVTVGKPLPDLFVSSFSRYVSPASSTVYYYVTVCNAGLNYSSDTTLEVYYDSTGAPPAALAGNQSSVIQMLGAGGCTSRTFTAVLPVGTHSSWAWVDRQNVEPEANETNNVNGPLSVTVGAPSLPDLKISKLGAQAAGNKVTYSIAVCNVGTASSSSCYVGVYYNLAAPPKPPATVADGSVYIGPIAAGGCFTASWLATLAAGAYSSWAYVDTSFMAAESDETNNVGGPTSFTVGAQTCAGVCATLLSPCALISSSQLQTCISSCAAQPQTKLDCAIKAASQQPPGCYDIITCLFS